MTLNQRHCLSGAELYGVNGQARLYPCFILAVQDILPSWENESVDISPPLLQAATMLDGVRADNLDFDQRLLARFVAYRPSIPINRPAWRAQRSSIRQKTDW